MQQQNIRKLTTDTMAKQFVITRLLPMRIVIHRKIKADNTLPIGAIEAIHDTSSNDNGPDVSGVFSDFNNGKTGVSQPTIQPWDKDIKFTRRTKKEKLVFREKNLADSLHQQRRHNIDDENVQVTFSWIPLSSPYVFKYLKSITISVRKRVHNCSYTLWNRRWEWEICERDARVKTENIVTNDNSHSSSYLVIACHNSSVSAKQHFISLTRVVHFETEPLESSLQ